MGELTPEQLRALYDEVERGIAPDSAGGAPLQKRSVGWSDPLVTRPKLPEQELRDLRQAELLERLSRQSVTPQQLMRQDEIALGENLGKYQLNTEGYRDRLKSGYEYTGYLGPGSALHTAGTWMSALPGAVYAAGEAIGQPLGDAVERVMSPPGTKFAPPGTSWRNKTPGRDLERALNTLTAPLQATVLGDADVDPDHSYWSMQREARKVPFTDSRLNDARMDFRNPMAAELDAPASGIEVGMMPLQGDQFLERWGAPRAAAMPAGLVMDTALDPFSAALPAAKLARAARYLPAAERAAQMRSATRALASDYIIGAPLTGYGALDELLRSSP